MVVPTQLVVPLSIGICTVACLWVLLRRSPGRRPLPPGPKPLPLIGNVLQMPRQRNWRTFAEWGRRYGDVVYIRLFGREVVILNSYKAVNDLMVQRSAQYSDRPQRVMAELCGYSRGLLFVEYGERWRKLRRLVHEQVTGQHATQYQPVQEAEANEFLKRLLDTPGLFKDHIRRFAGSLILQITYGYKVTSDQDTLVKLAEEVLGNISEVMTHGAFLVEALPILRHLPIMTPLLGRFLRTARRWRKNLDDFTYLPHEFVKHNLERGVATESFTSKALGAHEQIPISPDGEELITAAAASLYAGGADTAVSVTASFFLAMVLHPDIQKKAQEEIDRVIGNQRLPRISDRSTLPYVEAVALECLRWNPVAPLVTHSTVEDDTYRGYLIPARSAVVANVWAITHDESVYPEPMRFLPDRFLPTNRETTKNPHPRNFVFGFGRRVCPGQDMAEASLWIIVATTLAVFNISKTKDSNGVEITPEVEYTSRSFCHPKSFPCDIQPRSTQALNILQEL